MAVYASPVHVEAVMGRTLTEAERITALVQLEFACAAIRRKVPRVDVRLAAGTLEQQLVTWVAAQMVARHLRNPNGYRQEAIEDYSRTRDNSTATGAVYLTDEELELLAPKGSAFSITPGPERATLDDRRRIARYRHGWGRDGRC